MADLGILMGRKLQFFAKAKRVLVTGGAGYIGSHAVCELLDHGYQVYVIDDLSSGHQELVDARAELFVGSLANRDWLTQILAELKISAVLHFAGSIDVAESVLDPAKYYLNNFSNTLVLLECLRATGVQRLVFSSTASVYGCATSYALNEKMDLNPNHPYGRSKMLAEMAIADFSRSYGLGFCTLRYFNVAGAHSNGHLGEARARETHLMPLLLNSALSGNPQVKIFGHDYPTPDGTCIRDYVHVMDVAKAHAYALDSITPGSGTVLNVGSGRGFSVLEVIRACESITGIKFQVSYQPKRLGDVAALVADCSAILQTGWKPSHSSLEQMVYDTWQWQKSQKYLNCSIRRQYENLNSV